MSGEVIPVAPDGLSMLGGCSLKMCTVSVSLDTHINVELWLKEMEHIFAGYDPRLNWYSLVPEGMENTLITVP
jgi:hypothetical protein